MSVGFLGPLAWGVVLAPGAALRSEWFESNMRRFQFPTWVDRLLPILGAGVVFLALYVGGAVYVGGAPSTLDIGYKPKQPLPFSHAVHAGKLKMDCRFCHNTVDKAGHAAIPATATCGKCHSGPVNNVQAKTAIFTDSPKLSLVRESLTTGKPIVWAKVHDLPDYAYFNHSAHVARGVSCVSCHGRVDQMEEVRQVAPLSMFWCLECHRNPDASIRPPELVTKLDWKPDEDAAKLGKKLRDEWHINPKVNCSTCHR